jgi:cation:H+ antiporter
LLAVGFFMTGHIGRAEGGLLLAIAVIFTVLSLRMGDAEVDEAEADEEEAEPMGKALGLLLVGGAGLMVGAHFMVDGGTTVAHHYGISDRIIGLTIVAVGTSLPELAASIAGALKGHPGLAVGNVVGSCLFNLTFVLGASSIAQPMTTDAAAMQWDLATMGGLTVLMWMLLATGRRLSRVEGAALMAVYVGYMGFLVVTTLQGTAG